MATTSSSTATLLKLLSLFPLLLLVILVVNPAACMADYDLYSGQSLASGDYLANGNYTLSMRQDCNLVLNDVRNSSIIIWQSDTADVSSNCTCTLQHLGNLIIFTPGREFVWESNPAVQTGDYVLVLGKDGIARIYGPLVWDEPSGAMPVVTVVGIKHTPE